MDYTTATIDELRAEYQRLGGVLASAQEERKKIQELVERRKAQASAAAKVAELNPIQRDALLKALTEPT